MLKIDSRTSARIEALRFPLIVGVVFIHMGTNYSSVIVGSDDPFTVIFRFVVHLISIVIASSVVPLFFAISAYLLFSGFELTFKSYFMKVRSRTRTLLIPYLLWNLSYLMFKVLIQSNPILSSTVGGTSKRIVDYGWFDYFDALAGWTNFPVSYQFWFIRDLMLMVLIAPLFWLATKKFSALPVFIIFLIWIVDPGRIWNIHNETWLFFGIGCLAAQQGFRCRILRDHLRLLMFTYSILACVLAWLHVEGFGVTSGVRKVVTFAGVAALWYCSAWVAQKEDLRNVLVSLSSLSFFIFAAHEPLLGILMKLVSKLSIYQNSWIAFSAYFLVPLVTIGILRLLGGWLRSSTPSFFGLITGAK